MRRAKISMREPLARFDVEFVELAGQGFDGPVDRRGEADELRGGRSGVPRPLRDGRQIVDQEDSQRRDSLIGRDPHSVEARGRIGVGR